MTGAGNEAVAEFAGRIAALHRQTESARAALANTTASLGSTDGAVRASVDTSGVLIGIEFGAAARDLTSGDLAATVLRTVRQARVAALREAERRVAEAVGESSEAVAVLRRQLAALEQQSATDSSAPRATAIDDEPDGGFSGRGR